MARKQLTDTEREQIRKSLAETRERRKTQIIRVFELKVNCHQTKPETFKKFNNFFKQAKWIRNDMIALSKHNEKQNIDIFDYKYLEHKNVKHFDKNNNELCDDITLPVYLHRGMVANVKQDIVNLSKAKKKGKKIGILRFKSECNSIPILSGGIRIIDNSHITIPGFKNLKVYGLSQILNLNNYELADGRLVKKASGIYIHVSVCLNKENKNNKLHKEVGLDFGIKDNITTSDGEKFNCNV